MGEGILICLSWLLKHFMLSSAFKVTERVYIKGTFQDTTAALINFLVNLKMCGDFNLFTSFIFMFLKNWAQASLS